MSLRPLTPRDFVQADYCAPLPCSRAASNSSPGSQLTVLFASSACQPSAKPNLASDALL